MLSFKIEIRKLLQVAVIILLSIYIFFPSSSLRNFCGMFAVAIIFLLVILQKRIMYAIDQTIFFWGILIVFSVIVSYISTGFLDEKGLDEIKWLIIPAVMYILMVWTQVRPIIIIKVFYCFSLCFLLCTYLQVIFPDIINYINQLLLQTEELLYNNQARISGAYYGITSSNFLNAFFISIFEATMYAKIQTTEKAQYKNFILYVIGLGAIFLSGKKSIILANILTLLICFAILEKNKIEYLIKKFFGYFVLGTIILLLINTRIPLLDNIISTIASTDDISNGRLEMFETAWISIRENLWLGKGFGATYRLYSQGMHNIYIQLLYEIGIVCTILFVIFFVCKLANNFKYIGKVYSTESRYILNFSLYIQLVFLIYGLSGNALFYYSTLLIYFISLSIQTIEICKWKGYLIESRDINI